MDELAEKLKELQLMKDVGLIDLLVEKLEKSSYISSTTRSRVVEILQHKSPSSETLRLMGIFGQSTRTYIRRCDVRSVIYILQDIKKNQVATPPDNGESWVQEQWFCFLVDSDVIIKPLNEILNKLKVCRRSISPSLFTIVLFGEFEENNFFHALRQEFNQHQNFQYMTDDIMKKMFKYYGGISIEGSQDCLHVTAGNIVKSIWDGDSEIGTIGGFFKFGKRIVSVTAAHVVPQGANYYVRDADVAFIHINPIVRSVSNPLYVAPRTDIWDNFAFPAAFPFDPNFLSTLEPGTPIIKLGFISGFTRGILIGINESVTFYREGKEYQVNGVAVAWRNNETFTRGGDSGSVYYAIRGSFRYPIAVHCAHAYMMKDQGMVETASGKKHKIDIYSRISIGYPIAKCLEEYMEEFNERDNQLIVNEPIETKDDNETETDDIDEVEDMTTHLDWFDRLDNKDDWEV
jgi:hypothetical protein